MTDITIDLLGPDARVAAIKASEAAASAVRSEAAATVAGSSVAAANDAATRAIGAAVRSDASAAISKTKADESYASASRSEGQALASGRSATAAASSAAAVQTARDNALQAISTGFASYLTLSQLYQTVSSGLAATAANGYFAVAGTADVFATVYQKVNGAAVLVNVLASQAALDRIGRFIPAVLNTDNSIAINAALANALVSGVILPPGDIRLDHAITLLAAMSGKFVRGAGMGATRLIRTNNIDTAAYGDWAGVAIEGAVGTKVSDFTFVAPKGVAGGRKVQAVWYRNAAKFGLCERVEAFNCGYSFWAQEFASFIKFRDIRSFNGNVHFETTRATDIVVDGMVADDGDADNPLGFEATWHCLYGSKRVTFRNGVHRGKGQPYLIVADTGTGDEGLIDDITFQNLKSTQLDEKIAIFVSKINDSASVGTINLIDCEIDCTQGGGIPMQVQLGKINLVRPKIRGKSQDNIMVLPAATLECDSPDMYLDTPDGAYGSFFSNQGGSITVRGSSRMETISPLIDPGGINKFSGTLDWIAPAGKMLYNPPVGIEAARVYPIDLVYPNGTLFGGLAGAPDARTQIGLTDGGVYHIRMKGMVTAPTSGDDKRVGVAVDGLGGTVISGGITLQTAPDVFELHSLGTSKIYTGDSATFDLDVIVKGNGGTMTLSAAGNVRLSAGTSFAIKRIA
jgi:hypothetical protein